MSARDATTYAAIGWLLACAFVAGDAHAGALDPRLADAARMGDVAAIGRLSTQDSVNAPDDAGFTPLILASYHGHAEAAGALLDAGADPNIGDRRGNTALMGAVFQGHRDVVARLLASSKTDVNHRNRAGQTAAMLAALFDRQALLAQLAARGADIAATDANGNSAESLANGQGNVAMAQFIRTLRTKSQ
jgi:ankyrin repeat protein